MVSYYWGGAMVGRLIGSGLLFVVKQRAPLAAGRFRARRLRAVSHRDAAARRDRGVSRAVDRPVQLDHVPGDLHVDAGTVDRRAGGDFGPAVPCHRRRRDPAVYLWPDRGLGRAACRILPAGAWPIADHRVRGGLDPREDLRSTAPPPLPRVTEARRFMDDKARIDQQHSQLCSWLCDAAYPLWSTRGRDPAGGFHERLAQNGEPLAEPRRSRVNPRQAYCFAVAPSLGWRGDSAALVKHGLDYFRDALSASRRTVSHAGGCRWLIAR